MLETPGRPVGLAGIFSKNPHLGLDSSAGVAVRPIRIGGPGPHFLGISRRSGFALQCGAIAVSTWRQPGANGPRPGLSRANFAFRSGQEPPILLDRSGLIVRAGPFRLTRDRASFMVRGYDPPDGSGFFEFFLFQGPVFPIPMTSFDFHIFFQPTGPRPVGPGQSAPRPIPAGTPGETPAGRKVSP